MERAHSPWEITQRLLTSSPMNANPGGLVEVGWHRQGHLGELARRGEADLPCAPIPVPYYPGYRG